MDQGMLMLQLNELKDYWTMQITSLSLNTKRTCKNKFNSECNHLGLKREEGANQDLRWSKKEQEQRNHQLAQSLAAGK